MLRAGHALLGLPWSASSPEQLQLSTVAAVCGMREVVIVRLEQTTCML